MKPDKSQFLSLFFGGLLPVILFTIIEENYGTKWGLIAGLIFGCGEILFEIIKYKKVSKITIAGNALLIILGIISLFTSEGIWFKLQPAVMELFFALFLWGSIALKKPFLEIMLKQQSTDIPEFLLNSLNGLTIRLGLFFFIHSLLATWAALYWSTAAWAWLKGLGLTISMIVYLILEMLYIRTKAKSNNKSN